MDWKHRWLITAIQPKRWGVCCIMSLHRIVLCYWDTAQTKDLTAQEELDRENVKLARRLRTLLDERIPLSEIPKRMLAMDDVHSPLTTFNYNNFYYI